MTPSDMTAYREASRVRYATLLMRLVAAERLTPAKREAHGDLYDRLLTSAASAYVRATSGWVASSDCELSVSDPLMRGVRDMVRGFAQSIVTCERADTGGMGTEAILRDVLGAQVTA